MQRKRVWPGALAPRLHCKVAMLGLGLVRTGSGISVGTSSWPADLRSASPAQPLPALECCWSSVVEGSLRMMLLRWGETYRLTRELGLETAIVCVVISPFKTQGLVRSNSPGYSDSDDGISATRD